MRQVRRTRILALGLTLALAASAVACSGSSGKARVHSPDKRLSDAEYDYGASVRRVSGVTFQPDVVIPGGGAQSVRSVSADGLTWTLDGHAAEVGRLKRGMLLMVTNRGCGRVLGVKRVGGDVAVTIGPAALTDYIRDIDTSYSGAIDPKQIQFRSAPGLPSSADVTRRQPSPPSSSGPTPTSTAQASPTTVSYRPPPGPGGIVGASLGMPGAFLDGLRPVLQAGSAAAAPGGGTMPPPSPSPVPVVPVSGMTVTPVHGSDGGWGVGIFYNKGGLKVSGEAKLYLQSPGIHFDLKIAGGRIVTAEAGLSGVAGVRAEFEAGTTTGLSSNIHQIVDLPLDISIPIFGPALPFSANFHQSFKIDTVFSAKNSTFRFDGDYAFHGELKAGYRDGHFGVSAPAGFSVRKSLLQTISGVSVGVNGFVLAHQMRMIIGIGGFGFAVGPYVSLITSMGLVNGSDLGIVKCRGATLDLSMGYGIGYVIPKAVASVINVFLRALNLGEIRPSGGTPPKIQPLIHKEGYYPKLKICQGAI